MSPRSSDEYFVLIFTLLQPIFEKSLLMLEYNDFLFEFEYAGIFNGFISPLKTMSE